jgi:hypothetical protein
MGAVVASVVIVDWVGAIKVRAFWDSVCISVPNRACVVGSVQHAVLAISPCCHRNSSTCPTYNESECSPKPYKLGLSGRLVRSLTY